MPGLFSNILRSRRPRRRLQEGIRDQKTHRLFRSACRLLATRDHEQIPVAHFAQAAEMSVGAFYGRFPDKEAFLKLVISQRLSGARSRMETALDPARWRERSASAVTQAIAEEMIRDLHGAGAGVIRATLKCGHMDRDQLEPLRRYRAALADRAVALLAHRMKHRKRSDQEIRSAVQIAEATALDALLHDRGPLQLGSRHMAGTLSTMMLSMLDLPRKQTGTRHAEDDEPIEGNLDGGTPELLEMLTDEVVATPVPEPASGKRRARKQLEQVEPSPQVIAPAEVKISDTAGEDAEQPARRRRHRPRI